MTNAGNNTTVVLLQHPTGQPKTGVHIGVQHKELDTHLNEGDVLVRNLYVSVDPCKSPCPVVNHAIRVNTTLTTDSKTDLDSLTPYVTE